MFYFTYISSFKGMNEGYIRWDDNNYSNRNDFGGELPEGYYDHNTKVYYCCRADGFASNPIFLPINQPFYLIKKNYQCQEVRDIL